MQPQRVFLVDDDAAVRESVATLARARGLDVRIVGNAEQLLAQDAASLIGCVVTELKLADISAVGLLHELKVREVFLPVIVLTAHADVPSAVKAMQAGATTVLQKPCPQEVLEQVLDAALRREREQRAARREVRDIRQRLDGLVSGEVDVMDGLMAGKPNKRIAAELGIGLRTVELRRARLLKKMHAGSLAELVRMVTISGYQPRAADQGQHDV